MQDKIFLRNGLKIVKNRMMRNIVDYLCTKTSSDIVTS